MQNQTEIASPSVDFDAIRNFVEAYQVNTSESYLLASNELITLKKRRNEVVAFFADIKSKAHAAWKAIVAREKFFTDKIDAFESILKNKMLAFQQEQERIRREAERRLQLEAEKKAEAERQKLLLKASERAAENDELEVDMYVEAAMSIEAPQVQVTTSVPKASGITTREVWKAQVVDKQAFIVAAAADQKLAQYISIDVNTMVKQGWRECAGVKFYKERVMYASSK